MVGLVIPKISLYPWDLRFEISCQHFGAIPMGFPPYNNLMCVGRDDYKYPREQSDTLIYQNNNNNNSFFVFQ